MVRISISELNMRATTGCILITALIISFFVPYGFCLLMGFCGVIIIGQELPVLTSSRLSYSICALFYMVALILLCAGSLYPATQYLTTTIFALSFSHDSVAYVTGKLFGRRPLCPQISPGKTWEGFMGGVIASYLCLQLLIRYNYLGLHSYIDVLLATTISLAATGGDLFESFLKRRRNIKDAGNILPGHGGLLDRFDSISAVTYIVYGWYFLLSYITG